MERERVIELLSRVMPELRAREDLLGRPVDLVTERALRPELRPAIERERVDG
jgi:predicted nucleotidyltransferase